jgi:hypothetical protein
MPLKLNILIATGIIAGIGMVGGCADDPHTYGDQRPPVDSLSDEDRGLQSKDVLAASDQMAMDLLSDPELNGSVTQWTMVVENMEDLTRDRTFSTNFDVFLERLRTNISEQGHGRVRLIENKDQFHQLRDKELEGPADPYGQAGATPPPSKAINPDYALYGKAIDMPNEANDYYLLEFNVVNLQTREEVWSRKYEVKVRIAQ